MRDDHLHHQVDKNTYTTCTMISFLIMLAFAMHFFNMI
jgi:hypothetical protein